MIQKLGGLKFYFFLSKLLGFVLKGLFKFSKFAISIIIIMRRYVHNVDMKAF